MKRHVLPLLAALNLALAALLAWLWLTPQGEWRDLRWVPPDPVRPVFADAPPLPAFEIDGNLYVATLERPLFAPTRRPPPPPQAAASAPAADPLPDIRLLGVYGSKDAGGVVAAIDGKVRRLRVGEAIGSWSLKEVHGNEVVVARGDETRSIALKRSTGAEPPLAAASSAGGESAAAVSSGAPTAADTYRKSEAERVKTQVRRMNVLRARAGLPLLPEP